MSLPPNTPSNRLALSRERLRTALQRSPAAPEQGHNPAQAHGQPGQPAQPAQGAETSAAAWLHSLQAAPGLRLLMEAASSWWAKHPLRMASMLAADAAKSVAQPLAQRHPLGLVAGAFLLGAALVWSRPWRWIFKPVLLAGLVPHVFSRVANHLSAVPAQSWLPVLASLLGQQRQTSPGPMPAQAPDQQKMQAPPNGAWPDVSPQAHS